MALFKKERDRCKEYLENNISGLIEALKYAGEEDGPVLPFHKLPHSFRGYAIAIDSANMVWHCASGTDPETVKEHTEKNTGLWQRGPTLREFAKDQHVSTYGDEWLASLLAGVEIDERTGKVKR